jgi:hypothetical protein
MSNVAVESLLKQRQDLITERDRITEKFYNDISEIDAAIQSLTGRKASEVANEYKYDDENPNYIKGSFEEM